MLPRTVFDLRSVMTLVSAKFENSRSFGESSAFGPVFFLLFSKLLLCSCFQGWEGVERASLLCLCALMCVFVFVNERQASNPQEKDSEGV